MFWDADTMQVGWNLWDSHLIIIIFLHLHWESFIFKCKITEICDILPVACRICTLNTDEGFTTEIFFRYFFTPVWNSLFKDSKQPDRRSLRCPIHWGMVYIVRDLVAITYMEYYFSCCFWYATTLMMASCVETTKTFTLQRYNIDGLVQDRRKSIANELELRLFCTIPSIWCNHMETFSASLSLYAGTTGYRWIPLTKGQHSGHWRSFVVSFNKLLNKHSIGW